MNPLIIYHGNCYDGMTAAWIIKQIFPNADIFPSFYGDPPPYVHQRKVFIVDFSYPREIMIDMAEVANSILVLDHHISAKRNCEDLDFCLFDLDRSGAGMTWDYFHQYAPRPKWIDRVEDRDTWHFEYPDTREFHAFMSSMPISLASCSVIDRTKWWHIIEQGSVMLRWIDNSILAMIEERIVMRIDGEEIVMVNVPYNYASEVADYLLNIEPSCSYAIAWFQTGEGNYHYSLRSRKDEDVDVSEIAKKHGGGGHKNAAGFVSDEHIYG